MRFLAPIAALAAFLVVSPALAATPSLRVEGERFVLTLADGRQLSSQDLVGASFETPEGQTLRIDAVTPAEERPGVLLHSLSIFDAAAGVWTPLCNPDAGGRRAGFPVAGAWDSQGRYRKSDRGWFLACTGGSRGKCILWGYDPWSRGPKGEDLTAYYNACQFTARANYDGLGDAHTRNGTTIDLADVLGIQAHETLDDPAYVFEAGWGPHGAVCVATTRWPDLLTREALLAGAPELGGPCTQSDARQRGGMIFTRVLRR